MIKLENNMVTQKELMNRLAFLHEKMLRNNDHDNATKVLQLLRKVHNWEYMISLCGHFSAGKSSLINELIGEDFLPSSPIPTSANLVKVKSGPEYARVFFNHSNPIEYPAPYDYEMVKSFCKDGDAIESIEISHQTPFLPKGVAIMDTPGIDSSDDAHRVATESALHLADLILYVMDYNHVQSEINFQFTKQLTDQKKPVYLIVNQIDKHCDDELSFAEFKNGVEKSFQDWHVKPDRIFYTTLREKQHIHNDLAELRYLINNKVAEKDEYVLAGVINAAQQLISDHITFLNETLFTEKEEQYQSQLTIVSEQEQEVLRKADQLASELKELQKLASTAEKNFKSELHKISENAYLMPFETRELARQYIEACQPDFKIGFLFSKNKTEKERQQRLQLFYENLQDIILSQLEWHIREFFTAFLKEYNVANEHLKVLANKLTIEFEPKTIAQLVKQGARLTGDYVLTFTSDVANDIKKRYRNKALELLDEILQEIVHYSNQKLQTVEKNLSNYKKQLRALDGLHQIGIERSMIFEQLTRILQGEGASRFKANIDDLLTNNRNAREMIKAEHGQQRTEHVSKSKVEDEKKKETRKVLRDFSKGNVPEAIGHLREASTLLSDVTGFSSLSKEMKEKAERLEHRSYTVALFGAFSAGKSSFANALIGDRLLPVSPNPTTATINKIVPPTEKYPHGSVQVKIKSENQLLEDILHSLRVFDKNAKTVNEAIDVIKTELLNDSVEVKQKPHYAFLKAVLNGFQELYQYIGEQLTVGIEQFKEYVAKEEKACFVEWIELYYDCALTRQGITLVDTPGADSINTRHTGVAFNYIKNADAILFVTYYNHAFSKADREFLIQLGRVKDSFSMDKMFFIINAADLAHTKGELKEVEKYVVDKLTAFEIRHPRLYAISSQFAMAEKKGEEIEKSTMLRSSGIQAFEEDFQLFIIEELTFMAITSAYGDIRRGLNVLMDFIASANESHEVKQQRKRVAIDERKEIQSLITSFDFEADKQSVSQEIKELVYYCKQRIFLRFPDHFKESFNSSSLREDGRDIKRALNSCLQELLQFLGFDLSQEMRATSLRIETFMTKKLEEMLTELQGKSNQTNDHIQFSQLNKMEFVSPEFEHALQNLDKDLFKKSLSMFKNAKAFFEKNEKRFMSEQIETTLEGPVSLYLEQNASLLETTYLKQFSEAVENLKGKVGLEVEEYYEGILQALTEQVDMRSLEEKQVKLEQMVN